MSALYAHPFFVPCLLIWAIALPLLTNKAPRVATEPTALVITAPLKPPAKPKNKPPASFLPPPPPRLLVPSQLPPIGQFPRE